MRYKDFYAELGKLLYAVADIDHVITLQEKKALQRIVEGELVPNEKRQDVFGTNEAYYAEMEFDFLEKEIGDSEAAFSSFIDFVEEHHTAFDETMKRTSLRVAKELADAYYKTNRKEKQLIEKLIARLKKIH